MDQVWIPFKKHPLPVQNMYSPPLKTWNYYHLPITPDISAIKPSSTFSSSSDLSALMIQSFKHAAQGTLNLEGLIHLKIQLPASKTDWTQFQLQWEFIDWFIDSNQLIFQQPELIEVHSREVISSGLLIL